MIIIGYYYIVVVLEMKFYLIFCFVWLVDLFDKMDDIYVIVYCYIREFWLFCVWKDNFDDFEGFDVWDFKFVESKIV